MALPLSKPFSALPANSPCIDRSTPDGGRNFLHLANGLPMESAAAKFGFGRHGTPLLSDVLPNGCVLTDGAGVPLAFAVDGANRHDSKLVEVSLNRFQTVPPNSTTEQNLCLDKGFDYPHVYELVENYAYSPHIQSRGEKKW